MLVQRSLGLDDAQRVIAATLEYARDKEWRIAIVVVDRSGELIACARMDGRAPRYLKAAHRKAYTAAIFEMDTNGVMAFWKRQGNEGHRGPHDWNDSMFTTLPGGICVRHEGKVVGAVAVSGGGATGSGGGTSDWDFAEFAFNALGAGFTHSATMHQDVPEHFTLVPEAPASSRSSSDPARGS